MSDTSQVVGAIVASVCLYVLVALVLKWLLDGDYAAPAPEEPRPTRPARHRKG
ncbi:hypothetical protein ACRJ4B_49940 [Streptomyces sp. GTA36]